jgi:hypothetical protein
MKRSLLLRPAVLIVLLLAVAPLIGPAVAITSTPRPPASISPLPLPFSGGVNSISGTVFDASGHGIPNAKVTLYYSAWVGNDYKAKDMVKTDDTDNPQYTSDSGLYVYTNIPSGVYVLTAEKGGIAVSKNVMVTGGTTTENLYIQGYIENKATPTPSVHASPPIPTVKPTPVSSDTQEPDVGAVLIEVFKVLLMGVVGVQLVVSIVIIALQVGRR